MKRGFYMDQSILTINYVLRKALVTKTPKVNDDVLQSGGELSS